MATENFDRLHERVLQFVGAFTQAQFSMDYAIDRYVAGKMPRVGPAITAQFLGRVRDDQRGSSNLTGHLAIEAEARRC